MATFIPKFLDARGRACPWPIVELARMLTTFEVVDICADDPAFSADLVACCAVKNHAFTITRREGTVVWARVCRDEISDAVASVQQ